MQILKAEISHDALEGLETAKESMEHRLRTATDCPDANVLLGVLINISQIPIWKPLDLSLEQETGAPSPPPYSRLEPEHPSSSHQASEPEDEVFLHDVPRTDYTRCSNIPPIRGDVRRAPPPPYVNEATVNEGRATPLVRSGVHTRIFKLPHDMALEAGNLSSVGFCRNKTRFNEISGLLLGLELAEEPLEDQVFVSPEVQVAYKHVVPLKKQQAAFDATASLLLHHFTKPFQPYTRPFQELGLSTLRNNQERRVVVYTISLNKRFLSDCQDPRKFTASKEFCELLTWCAGYLYGTTKPEILSDVINRGSRAYEELNNHIHLWHSNHCAHAQFSHVAALRYEAGGHFQQAQKLLEETLKTRKKHLKSDEWRVCMVLSDLALLKVSQGNHIKAQEYIQEACDTSAISSYDLDFIPRDKLVVWLKSISALNVIISDPGEAQQLLELCRETLETPSIGSMQVELNARASWYHLALVYFWLGNLELMHASTLPTPSNEPGRQSFRDMTLKKAWTRFDSATAIATSHRLPLNHPLAISINFKYGTLALLDPTTHILHGQKLTQGAFAARLLDARPHNLRQVVTAFFEEMLLLLDKQPAMMNHRARILYALTKLHHDNFEAQAQQKTEDEAKRILASLRPKHVVEGWDEYSSKYKETKFDELVPIFFR
ncbi:hypothetical protein MMC18_007125 [Xylographa bjoerkii]|nr:hypothetical protein [Xylographa bjoerkii]